MPTGSILEHYVATVLEVQALAGNHVDPLLKDALLTAIAGAPGLLVQWGSDDQALRPAKLRDEEFDVTATTIRRVISELRGESPTGPDETVPGVHPAPSTESHRELGAAWRFLGATVDLCLLAALAGLKHADWTVLDRQLHDGAVVGNCILAAGGREDMAATETTAFSAYSLCGGIDETTRQQLWDRWQYVRDLDRAGLSAKPTSRGIAQTLPRRLRLLVDDRGALRGDPQGKVHALVILCSLVVTDPSQSTLVTAALKKIAQGVKTPPATQKLVDALATARRLLGDMLPLYSAAERGAISNLDATVAGHLEHLERLHADLRLLTPPANPLGRPPERHKPGGETAHTPNVAKPPPKPEM